MGEPTDRIKIFDYDNYREFLRDRFAQWKRQKTQFSYRFFAKLAGVQAHSFVIRVLQDKVDLSEESALKFARALKLNQGETDFFLLLVRFNQAKSSQEKHLFAQEIMRVRGQRKINSIHESQFRFYDNWFYPPIRELVTLDTFKEDPEWVAKTIVPHITVQQAKRALEDLQLLGLLQRDKNGKLVQADPLIATQDEVTSTAVAQFHREMMKRAAESIDRTPRDQRAIMSQTFGVSTNGAQKIKDMIIRFRKEVFEVIASESDPKSVYQLNFQLFPLTLGESEEKK